MVFSKVGQSGIHKFTSFDYNQQSTFVYNTLLLPHYRGTIMEFVWETLKKGELNSGESRMLSWKVSTRHGYQGLLVLLSLKYKTYISGFLASVFQK